MLPRTPCPKTRTCAWGGSCHRFHAPYVVRTRACYTSWTTVLWLFARGDTTRGMTLFLPASPPSLLTTCQRAWPSSLIFPVPATPSPLQWLSLMRGRILSCGIASKYTWWNWQFPLRLASRMPASARQPSTLAWLPPAETMATLPPWQPLTGRLKGLSTQAKPWQPVQACQGSPQPQDSPGEAANCESYRGILCHLVQPQPLFLKKLFQNNYLLFCMTACF